MIIFGLEQPLTIEKNEMVEGSGYDIIMDDGCFDVPDG